MTVQFQKATKKRSKLRLAFDGPAGSGKTMSALKVARGLAGPDGKVAVIDTERGSASLYSDQIEFDVVELDDFGPDKYVEAIHVAEDAGYAVVVIDSLSHAWEGKGGALELKDKFARTPGMNDWTAWRAVTPAHNRLVDAMLQSKAHVIVTMRTKMEYVQEKDEKGKTVIRKVGMAPIQRPGLEYEFTVVGDLDQEHVLTISKTRCGALDRGVIPMPGERFAKTLLDWLDQGDATPVPQANLPPAVPNGNGAATQPPVSNAHVAPGAEQFSFATLIANAKNVGELEAVAVQIGQAKSKGKVSAAERDELLALYEKRDVELARGAAA